MKFSCLKTNIHPVLQLASKIVSTRPTLPVLNNILVKTTDGRIYIESTNLELSVKAFVGGKVAKDGGITVPAKLLSEFVSSVPAEKIEFSIKDNALEVQGGTYQAVFNGIDIDEFPEAPQLKGSQKLTVPASVLADNIPKVVMAAAADEARPVITGVLLSIDGDNLVMVAADGYRLAEKKIKLQEDSGKRNIHLIIPAKSLVEVQRLLADAGDEEHVEITYDENQAVFAFKDVQISTRILAGQFPDYKQIIPAKNETSIQLKKDELNQAVKTAALFARDSASVIRFETSQDNKQVLIKAAASQVGTNEIAVPAEITGTGGSIAFNSRYVLDFLGAVSADTVSLKINDPLSPGVLTTGGQGEESYIYVIMPIRT
ncbi:MAG TPA: DNA polymerase III subunit beta [bacterium]|nr:DNA polymerase III subunit beta [bacterium]